MVTSDFLYNDCIRVHTLQQMRNTPCNFDSWSSIPSVDSRIACCFYHCRLPEFWTNQFIIDFQSVAITSSSFIVDRGFLWRLSLSSNVEINCNWVKFVASTRFIRRAWKRVNRKKCFSATRCEVGNWKAQNKGKFNKWNGSVSIKVCVSSLWMVMVRRFTSPNKYYHEISCLFFC